MAGALRSRPGCSPGHVARIPEPGPQASAAIFREGGYEGGVALEQDPPPLPGPPRWAPRRAHPAARRPGSDFPSQPG